MHKLLQKILSSKKLWLLQLISLICLLVLIPNRTNALNSSTTGEQLFIQHCAGCHVNGGNIIRRNRTLKLSALKRQGLDDPEAIAKIAREGIGSMSGYQEVLGESGDQLVAKWVWDNAQNAWTH